MNKTLKNQRGGAMVALIAVLVILAALVGICAVSYINAYNYGNKMDNQLIAIKENNKNIYAQGTQMIMEIAQVPGMYKDDLQAVITADVQGTFGKNGSTATMQWFKQRDIKLEPALYTKIQQVIEGFRNKFEVNQTQMIDVVRSYRTTIGTLWTGFWLRIAGFPKINLDEYKPVTTDRTEKVFKAGKEDAPLQLRPKSE